MKVIRDKVALVTAIGSFSAEAVISGLRKNGFRVVGCDIHPAEWIASSLDVDVFYQVPRLSAGGAYVEAIAAICRQEGVTYILPLTDPEIDILSVCRERFAEEGVHLLLSPPEVIERCRDKYAFYEYCRDRAVGFKAIPTKRVQRDMWTSPFSFPMVCKPVNGRSSQGMHFIQSQREWELFISELAATYIVQPRITGEHITVDVVRQLRNDKAVAMSRQELLRTLNGAGVSVYAFHNEEFSKTCCDLARDLGIVGCVNFEFIRDEDGSYWLLECNPRFSGGVSFSCAAGYDMVTNHLRCFEESQDIDDAPVIRPCYMARRYEQWVTATS